MPKEMKYKAGDIVSFNFTPGSSDFDAPGVLLVGSITGILYEEEGYNVRISDKGRNIHGDLYVPEIAILAKIED